MRSGWLAFLVSVALHGAVLAALCLMPGVRVEKNGPVFVQEAPDSPEGDAILLVSRETEIMDIPPPLRPAETPSHPLSLKPKPLPASPAPVSPEAKSAARGMETGSAVVPGSLSGSGGTRTGAATTFFQVPGKGQRIVYLIDASASMGLHGALEMARTELLRSVRRLPDPVEFQIIVFNRYAFPLVAQWPDWLKPTPESVVAIENALRDLPAEGGTDPCLALKYALSRQPAVLFFLTDAGEFRPDIVREITRFNHGRSTIHVIELNTRESSDSALQTLAQANGGVFRAVSLRSH